MTQATILLIGLTPTGTAALQTRISNKEWHTVVADTAEAAVEMFYRQAIDVAIIGKNVSREEDKMLRKIFCFKNADMIILDGDENTDFAALITAALAKKEAAYKHSISFTDDALKNAGLNIKIEKPFCNVSKN